MQAGRMARCFRLLATNFPLNSSLKSPIILPVASYRSQYNLEHLYPNSCRDFVSKPGLDFITKQGDSNEEFCGYIPIDKITISYSRSSGPGGQNVNKVNTKVEVRFHVESAEWIPQWIRERLLLQEQGRINKQGFLIVTSDKTRKQMLNQADCMDKIRTIIFNSCSKPYEPTEEEIQLKDERLNRARKGILLEKRQKSLKKQYRQSPTVGNV